MIITMTLLWLQVQERSHDLNQSQPSTAPTGFMSWIPGKQGARPLDHSVLLENMNAENKSFQEVSSSS